MLKPFKKHILAILYLLGLVASSQGQTADSRVAEGRVFLEQENLSSAHAKFAAALALDANHANANFFYAATRILSLATTPSGTTFLNRIGIGASGRDIYHWNAKPAQDVNGDLIAPTGVNANEFTGHLRTQILPELIGAGANLAKITNPFFQVSLTAAETTSSEVTVDYGDVLMLRALLHGLEYWVYTVNSWNVDAQLTALKNLGDAHDLTAQRLLADYPQLFTFATTADMNAARTAFENLVARYQDASVSIRGRSSQDGLLFQYDEESQDKEQDFRDTLADLRDSLAGPEPLTVRPRITYHLARHFSGAVTPRSFLPQFQDNRLVLGTLPDHTFDGLVTGGSSGSIYKRLGDIVPVASRIRSITQAPDDYYALKVDHLDNRSSAIFGTEDFQNWFYMDAFLESYSNQVDTIMVDVLNTPPYASLFLRVETMTDGIFYAAQIVDAEGTPVNDAAVSLDKSFEHADFTDGGGYVGINAFNRKPVFPDTLFRIYIDKPPYPVHATSYRLSAGATFSLQPPVIVLPYVLGGFPPPENDAFADALTVTGFPVVTTGSNVGATAEVDEPGHADGDAMPNGSVWWKWTAPFTGEVSITTEGSDFDTLLGVYTGTSVNTLTLIGEHDGEPPDYLISTVTFTAQQGVTYYIAVDGYLSDVGDITLSILNP